MEENKKKEKKSKDVDKVANQKEKKEPKEQNKNSKQETNSKNKKQNNNTKNKKENKTNKNINEKNNKKEEEKIQVGEKQEEKSNKIKKTEKLEIQEEVEKELKNNKKLPKEEQYKLNSIVFQNLCTIIVIMIYFIFLILGFINIEIPVLITDFKVFSLTILALAIIFFEIAYKKDSGKYCITGIEMLVLSLVTVALMYMTIMYPAKYIYIISTVSFTFAIYYVGKAIVLYCKTKKNYSIDSMNKIIKNK